MVGRQLPEGVTPLTRWDALKLRFAPAWFLRRWPAAVDGPIVLNVPEEYVESAKVLRAEKQRLEREARANRDVSAADYARRGQGWDVKDA